jgi:hypothetical protein
MSTNRLAAQQFAIRILKDCRRLSTAFADADRTLAVDQLAGVIDAINLPGPYTDKSIVDEAMGLGIDECEKMAATGRVRAVKTAAGMMHQVLRNRLVAELMAAGHLEFDDGTPVESADVSTDDLLRKVGMELLVDSRSLLMIQWALTDFAKAEFSGDGGPIETALSLVAGIRSVETAKLATPSPATPSPATATA